MYNFRDKLICAVFIHLHKVDVICKLVNAKNYLQKPMCVVAHAQTSMLININ